MNGIIPDPAASSGATNRPVQPEVDDQLTLDLGALFTAPRITSGHDADGVLRHRDDAGQEYRAVEVDGEVTYEPVTDADASRRPGGAR